MTAPATSYETEEERQRRLLLEQQAPDQGGATGAPGGPAAPGGTATTPAGAPLSVRPTGTPRATSTSIPTGFAPPPPPPPPPPPDLAALASQTSKFASDWMANPNRYTSDLATATRAAGDLRLTKAEQDAQRGIEEWAQGRGLIGSSYEGDLRRERTADIGRQRAEDERALLEMLATSEAMDREKAGAMGLETVRAEDVMGLDRYRAQLEAAQLAEAQRQFGGTQGVAERTLDLRAQELQQEAALQGRSLDLQAARDAAAREVQLGELGISQQQVDLRARELVQQAATEGRTLDLQQARQEAETALAREQMVQQSSQFAQTLTEQQTARLQELGVTQQQLDLEARKLQQQAQLEGRSLDLQAARDQAANAIQLGQLGISQGELDQRAQQLVQEAAAQNRTLDLTAARDAATREYQFAALAQEGTVAQRDFDLRVQQLQQQAQLEGRSLTLQEAQAATQREAQLAQLNINQQEVNLRADQLVQEARAQNRTLDLTEARDLASQTLQREEMQLRARLQTDELAQRESEFARTQGLNEREFIARTDQATRQYGEQVAARLQQNTQFATALQSEDARAAVDAGLRERALELQGQGMTLDESFRRASLEQEGQLTLSAQALTARGMAQEDAYRYAALSQDARFRQDANRLTQLGLTQEDAYRYAEIAYRDRALQAQGQQFSADLEFRTQQLMQQAQLEGRSLDLQAARDQAQREQYASDDEFRTWYSEQVLGVDRGADDTVTPDPNTNDYQSEVDRQTQGGARPVRIAGEDIHQYNARLNAWLSSQGLPLVAF